MPPRPAAAAAFGALLLALLSGVASGRLLRRGAEHKVSAAVKQPLTDHRRFQHVTFAENGLKVLAVEDPRAAKAGFAVAVEAGSFYDPPAFPGLAHFCEHLLFLGTKKYPDEASFDQFMSIHDGSTNAYTEQERTVFYNEVGLAGFEEGMDRFAQFFIAPLFKQELVGKELNAVNSEHEKNKPDQGRRLWEVLRSTARSDSVLSHFYTGTTESLHHGDAAAVSALRRYHDANYCAPRMTLVMVSNISVAEQLRAAHRHFDAVPRGSCGAPANFASRSDGGSVELPPFDAHNLGQFVRMGTNSTPALWIMLPLSPTVAMYRKGPMQYLQYVLSYAGAGSLRSTLKRRGLISGLGIQVDETSAATLFFLMFQLTPAGAADAGVRDIVKDTFSFLQLLRERSDEVPAVYDSLQRMSRVSFDYADAPDSVMEAVSSLASSAAQFGPEDVLTGSLGLIEEQDPALVRQLLSDLARGPQAANFALEATGFDASQANGFEKYYGVHYHQGQIPSDWLQSAEALPSLRPPPPLRFVPQHMALLNETAGARPEQLAVLPEAARGGAPLELWWQGRGAFSLPKAQLRLKLTPAAAVVADGADEEALRRLHAGVVKQALEEATEDMQNCGMGLSVEAGSQSYHISVDGYSEHLDVMLLRSLDNLLDASVEPEAFARAQRSLLDELSDTSRRQPYELALDAVSAVTTSGAFSREEVLASLRGLDLGRLRSYITTLRSKGLRAQLLVVGNVGRGAAQSLAERTALAVVGARGAAGMPWHGRLLAASEARHSRVWVASRPVELRMRNPVPGDSNHVTLSVFQYGVTDVAERVRMLLLGKMIENPVYDTLRTKEQLGYIVFGFVTEHSGVLELRVLVQGSRESPDRVDVDIDAVVDAFGHSLRNMSLAEFQNWKGSVRSALNHKDQNMAQEADRYWSQITNDGHCFNRKELALQYLDSLQIPEDMVKTFDRLRNGHHKVSVKMFGAGLPVRPPPAALQALAAGARPGGELATVSLVSADSSEKRRLLATADSYYPTETICRI